jgi:hypothetical protein
MNIPCYSNRIGDTNILNAFILVWRSLEGERSSCCPPDHKGLVDLHLDAYKHGPSYAESLPRHR